MAFLSSLLPTSTTSSSNGNGLAGAINQREIKAWAPIVGGGAMLLYGLSRRSLPGLLLASVGGFLLYRGTSSEPKTIRTGATTTISRSPEELYTFWRDLEKLPTIMQYIVSVREIDDKRSHWVASTVAGRTVEWDAEIVAEEPNRSISWRSDPESDVQTSGEIRFDPAPGDRGTEVHLTLEYSIPFGVLGAAEAAAMGYEPSQLARQDLQRFKQYMETGEIATTTGQPAGERGRAPDVETVAGTINNVLEGLNILRTGGKPTRSRAGTRT